MKTTESNLSKFADASFDQEVLGAEAPVLVDFWADWYGPCHAIAPTVKALAKEYAGKVRVGKLNIDENAETPEKFGIRGIPTLILFKGGQIVDRVVGVASLANLKAMLDRALAG